MAKDSRFAFRTTAEKRQRLKQAAEFVGLTETALVEAWVDALVSHIEMYGEITLPMMVVSQPEYLRVLTKADPEAAAKLRGILKNS